MRLLRESRDNVGEHRLVAAPANKQDGGDHRDVVAGADVDRDGIAEQGPSERVVAEGGGEQQRERADARWPG
jgi:hypothetical protein